MKKMMLLGLAALVLLLPLSAMAGSVYPLVKVYPTGGVDIASQLTVGVYGTGDAELSKFGVTLSNNQVLFVFRNNANVASSIADVYFQDGALLDMAAVYGSAGVSFVEPAGNLYGGTTLDPQFIVTKHFSARSTAPIIENGVNASTEWLGIVFDLKNGMTYSDVINAMANWKYAGGEFSKKDPNAPSLRIGIRAEGVAGDRQGSSYINTVPEPSLVLLLGIGLGAIGLVARRRN